MSSVRSLTPNEFKATPADRRALRLVDDDAASVQVLGSDGQPVKLPEELESLLLSAVRQAAEGHEVALLSSDEEVSPAKAGKLLGLSRQYVDRLIAEGVLPARRIPGSTHRKIRVADVIAFDDRRTERRKGITNMVETLVDAGAEY